MIIPVFETMGLPEDATIEEIVKAWFTIQVIPCRTCRYAFNSDYYCRRYHEMQDAPCRMAAEFEQLLRAIYSGAKKIGMHQAWDMMHNHCHDIATGDLCWHDQPETAWGSFSPCDVYNCPLLRSDEVAE